MELTAPTKEIRYFDKDEESFVPFDWTGKLAAQGVGVQIANAQFILPDGMEKYHEGFSASKATVWLRLLDKDKTGMLPVVCRITTNEVVPQKFDRTVFVKLAPF